MRIKTVSLIESMSGKLDKDENIVFRTAYGKTIAYEFNAYRGPYTAEQNKVKAIFTQASTLAAADMADPEKKAMWKAVAKSSKGQWKTARGAAFASHYNELKNAAAE